MFPLRDTIPSVRFPAVTVGLIVVNAFILYLLDILSQNLTIDGIPALIYASVIIGLVNFVFHFATKE